MKNEEQKHRRDTSNFFKNKWCLEKFAKNADLDSANLGAILKYMKYRSEIIRSQCGIIDVVKFVKGRCKERENNAQSAGEDDIDLSEQLEV